MRRRATIKNRNIGENVSTTSATPSAFENAAPLQISAAPTTDLNNHTALQSSGRHNTGITAMPGNLTTSFFMTDLDSSLVPSEGMLSSFDGLSLAPVPFGGQLQADFTFDYPSPSSFGSALTPGNGKKATLIFSTEPSDNVLSIRHCAHVQHVR